MGDIAVLILVNKKSPRLKYVFDELLIRRMGLEYEFTIDVSFFLNHSGSKFSYGVTVQNELFFDAVPLLWEATIEQDTPQVVIDKGVKGLFPVSNGALSFDLFASAFYLLSRYEEYLPSQRDKHRRFLAEASISYKNDFLRKPVVDQYAHLIASKLQVKHIESKSNLLLTIDIDNAYAYCYKGFLRTLGSLVKKILNLKFKTFVTHLLVLIGFKKDKYDSYDKMDAIHKKYGLKPIYFYLVGSNGGVDKNLNIKLKRSIDLLNRLKKEGDIALHPSYASNLDVSILKKEKKSLENVLGEMVTKSRQHYLMLEFPKTYQNLIEVGIRDDYTMGYHSQVGYRAGTAKPFYFFNLEKNKKENLQIHPFYVMDTTLQKYLKFSSGEALVYLKENMSNTDCTLLFHNESIGGEDKWTGWEDFYEGLISQIKKGISKKS